MEISHSVESSYLSSRVTVYLCGETCGTGVTRNVRLCASKKAVSGPSVGSKTSCQLRIQTFPDPPFFRRLSAAICRARRTKAFISERESPAGC